MTDRNDPRLDAAIRAAATALRKGLPALSCERALALAREHGVGADAVGAACDRLGIKIMSCQLGCFA